MKLYHGDCLKLLKKVKTNSVDLLITDPPYEFNTDGGGGAFGSKKQKYHSEIKKVQSQYDKLYVRPGATRIDMSKAKQRLNLGSALVTGFDMRVLDECCRVMKKINAYVWCSKAQVSKLLNYFIDKGCNIDILTWHKTNPIPTCNNSYLSDTEYLIFAREKGVNVYGEYATKRKWYVSKLNVEDKKKWNHPTIKPLPIIENLIINSSVVGGGSSRPFYG